MAPSRATRRVGFERIVAEFLSDASGSTEPARAGDAIRRRERCKAPPSRLGRRPPARPQGPKKIFSKVHTLTGTPSLIAGL
jgi:hypothetical protein